MAGTQVLPAYLNALSGKGVHVVTVNDYLAKRDSEWVGQIHRFLGLNVGLVQQGLDVSDCSSLMLLIASTALSRDMSFSGWQYLPAIVAARQHL